MYPIESVELKFGCLGMGVSKREIEDQVRALSGDCSLLG
jgi:hypothetical protein